MRNARHLIVATLASAAIAFPFAAHAKTVVSCGTMEGYGYFYPSPFVQADQQGFDENQVTKNRFVISQEGEQYDVSRHSEAGKIYSSLADGAKVVPIANNKDHFVLWVGSADKTAEIYSYHKPTKTLTLLQLKYGALVTSSKLLVTNCE